MNIVIPHQVKIALSTLSKKGYKSYIVGGCVRDSLLSVTPPDWDITTSAKPGEILSVFNNYKTVETGIKHGTITVIIDDMPLEITTFRIDGDYLDNRHPRNVKFCSNLNEDLKRRDFTINAMAYNEQEGLIDIYNSKYDLNNKILKCVGDPNLRFKEDALRILRALRFSSTLNFSIEKNTSDSIHQNVHLLKNVSKERVANELLKLLCGENVVNVLLNYRDIIAIIIPEIEPTFDFDQRTKYHIFDVWEHTVYAVGFSEPDPTIRLAVLLHDIGKPHCFTIDKNGVGHFYGHGKISSDISSSVVNNLKLSNEMKDNIITLTRYHDYPIEPNEKKVKKCLAKFSLPVLEKLLKVKTADILAHNPKYAYGVKDIEKIKKVINKVLEDNKCFKIKDLKINGNDLIEIGLPEDKIIGIILEKLLYKVIDEKLENNKHDLLKAAKEIYGGMHDEKI